jgi:hypothetical protein
MTKFTLKTLAVAVALAAAGGQANATMVNAQGTLGDGNSSVIMYAFSDSLGRSYSRDLGFNLNDFLYNGAVAPTAGSLPFNPAATPAVSAGNVVDSGYALNFGSDALMTSWLGNGSSLASDVKWGIAAVDGQGTGAAFRALTTIQAGAVNSTANSGLSTFEGKFDVFLGAQNVLGTHVSGLNGSAGSDGTNDPAASAATGFGVNWTGGTNFFAAGGVGESMEFISLAGNGTIGSTKATGVRYGNADGFATWTLNADGGLAYAAPSAVVPVPPAMWLFGSGLLGLVGIARRKRIA